MCDQSISAAADQVTIGLANGRRVTFANIDRDASGPACFVLGVRKSGELAAELDLRCIGELQWPAVGRRRAGTFFFSNVRTVAVGAATSPCSISFCREMSMAEFRDMPHVLTQSALFATAPKLMMVRDPRDVLVSEYFRRLIRIPFRRLPPTATT